MNDKINISKGDIPETDAEVEKILAKKTPKRKLALVTPPEPEKQEEEKTPTPPVIQPVLKHKDIVWHPLVNGLDVYGYSSQEILDVADKVYQLYNQTPVIQLSGDVLVGSKVVRLKYEAAEYVNVTDDHWHLIYSDLDVEPANGTFPKARVGVNKPEAVEKWEASLERKTYRAKLMDSIKLA
jgi:hypothetical protein